MTWKKVQVRTFLVILILALALTGCSLSNSEESKQIIKLGILPVDDSLPLIVAEQKGFFEEENFEVELITFQSAVESQSALQAGQIDGMLTDIVVTALLKESGLDIKITSVIGSSQNRRRFAIVAAPNSGIEKIEDLKGTSIGISNNSIIEYITDKLLADAGINNQDIEKTSIPKIPVRLEMLISKQIDAVNIPEPLVSFAELQGAKVIVDDTTNPQLSQVVLIMTDQMLQKKLDGFFKAYAKAIKEINADPNQFKETLINNINIPEPVIEIYQVSTYPELQLPSEKDVNDVLDWLNEKGLLEKSTNYDDLIQTGLY